MAIHDERIERVIAFIESHYGERITLGRLAEEANFSPFHFSRVFQAATGLPAIRYLKERRLEKAAARLLGGNEPVTEIALGCGFESLSSFNALFKERYALTPTELREKKLSKIPGEDGKNPRAVARPDGYPQGNSLLRRIWDMNVTINERPSYRIAYFRHTGSYLETAGNWEKLLAWVGAKDLFKRNPLFIGISWDDPESTDEDACRHDACITLPEGFPEDAEGGVRFDTIPAGSYAEYLFFDTIDKLPMAYRALYFEWLPQSGCELEPRPALEINLNNPADDPEHRSKCLICLPLARKS